MFTMIVPVLLVWIAYILDRTVKINFKLKEEQVNSLDHLKN